MALWWERWRSLLAKWVPKVIYLCNLYRSDPDLLWFWLNSSWKEDFVKCTSFFTVPMFSLLWMQTDLFYAICICYSIRMLWLKLAKQFKKSSKCKQFTDRRRDEGHNEIRKTRLISSSGQLKRVKATNMYISSIIPVCSSIYDIIYNIISHNISQYCNTWYHFVNYGIISFYKLWYCIILYCFV